MTGMPEPETESVTLFSSSATDAEMEALQIRALLEANGIPSVVVGPSTIPSLEFQVQVGADDAEHAARIVEEARAAGPEAAAEAEAAGEQDAL